MTKREELDLLADFFLETFDREEQRIVMIGGSDCNSDLDNHYIITRGAHTAWHHTIYSSEIPLP